MLLSELFEPSGEKEQLTEGPKIAWARVGNKVVRKYRCVDGPRQGRIVAHPNQCYKPIDYKRHVRFERTKNAKKTRIGILTQLTKKHNPASLRVQRMNKEFGE